MVTQFQRGQKTRLSDLTQGTDLYVGVQISGSGLVFDISCFGLDADERLSDDRYFLFYNQPKSPEEAIQLLGSQAGDTESFRVTLDRVPAGIHRLAFTAAIDGEGTMAQAAPGYIRIVAGGQEVARYSFDGSAFTTERAVMLADFYRKDGWRFAAVGQGFDGGLGALLKYFGGEVAEDEEQEQQSAAPPGFAPPPGPGQQSAAPPGFAPPPGPAAPPPAPAPAAFQPSPPAVVPSPPPAAPMAPAPAPAAFQPSPPAAPMAPQGGGYGPPQAFVPVPAPAPGPAPQPHQPQPGAGLQDVLNAFRGPVEQGGPRWGQPNPHLVRVNVADGQPVMARLGSMVFYHGAVEFSFKGGGLKRRLTTGLTGEGLPALMRCTGTGQVFLARQATRLHPVELQGDTLCVSSQRVLAFDESLDFEVRRIDGHGIPGGSLFALEFRGHGTVVLTTLGEPVVLPVTAMTFADANAVVAWSSGAQVLVANQVRLRRYAYSGGDSGETTQLQFRGAPGNFAIVQPYEI